MLPSVLCAEWIALHCDMFGYIHECGKSTLDLKMSYLIVVCDVMVLYDML